MYEAYEIWLTTDQGTRVALLTNFQQMQYSIIANDVGQLSINLPSTFDTSLLVADRTIQVWRAPVGTNKMSLQRLYVIEGWKYARQSGSLSIVARAFGSNSLLARRVIAAYSGTSLAAKTDYADDMMRELVNENMVAALDSDRDMSFVDVAPELTAGPILQMRFSYKNLLSTLRSIGDASRAAGTEIFFDMHADATSSSFSCEFRTKTGQPGADNTDQGVLFSSEMGNLENTTLDFDYRGSANVVYGLGQGSGVSQNIQEVEDTDRSGASRFARKEAAVSASSQQEDDEVTAVARSALNKLRPVRQFTGNITDSRAARYGVDWWFGSKVTVRAEGHEFDAIVRAVNITLDEAGQERIQAKVEYES